MKLSEYFENAKGVGVLATADAEGKVNAAIYARPHFLDPSDENTIAFIMADRLCHANMQANPHASYLFIEEGEGYTGKRLSLMKIKEKTDADKIQFDLPDADFALLYEACARHTDGETEADITIQTCWDADRLDLGRVGMMPEPTKLCTPAARAWEMIQWADGRAAFEVVPELVKGEWGIDLRG